MPVHGPAPGRNTALPLSLPLIGKQCFQAHAGPADSAGDVARITSMLRLYCCSESRVLKHHQSTRRRFSFSLQQYSEALVRVPAWDLLRHGCRRRAYRDVLAACPTPVRVQAPSVIEAFARNRQTSCVGLVDAAPRSHSSRLLIGTQCILGKRSNHQPPKSKTASRSLRRPSGLHRLADGSATPPQPSYQQPRHAGADATSGWRHPTTPARWLR